MLSVCLSASLSPSLSLSLSPSLSHYTVSLTHTHTNHSKHSIMHIQYCLHISLIYMTISINMQHCTCNVLCVCLCVHVSVYKKIIRTHLCVLSYSMLISSFVAVYWGAGGDTTLISKLSWICDLCVWGGCGLYY